MKVFVYGSLKQGFSNSYLLSSSKFITKAEIKGNMYSLGAYPVADLEGEGIIKGEVYEISPNNLIILDTLEGYPNFYNRRVVTTLDKRHKVITYFIEHNRIKRFELIKSGEWNK